MRVVGGIYRSRVLKEFANIGVRPTSDKVKESLFNILSFQVRGCSFLDLFTGTGSIGIEALSRGAIEVVFLDAKRESVELCNSNLKMLKVENRAILQDALFYLKNTDKKFDIIFIDPPYSSDIAKSCLTVIAQRNLLNENGVCVYESENPYAENIENLELIKEKKYGRVYLAILKRG